jgi:hypothetical protein
MLHSVAGNAAFICKRAAVTVRALPDYQPHVLYILFELLARSPLPELM